MHGSGRNGGGGRQQKKVLRRGGKRRDRCRGGERSGPTKRMGTVARCDPRMHERGHAAPAQKRGGTTGATAASQEKRRREATDPVRTVEKRGVNGRRTATGTAVGPLLLVLARRCGPAPAPLLPRRLWASSTHSATPGGTADALHPHHNLATRRGFRRWVALGGVAVAWAGGGVPRTGGDRAGSRGRARSGARRGIATPHFGSVGEGGWCSDCCRPVPDATPPPTNEAGKQQTMACKQVPHRCVGPARTSGGHARQWETAPRCEPSHTVRARGVVGNPLQPCVPPPAPPPSLSPRQKKHRVATTKLAGPAGPITPPRPNGAPNLTGPPGRRLVAAIR